MHSVSGIGQYATISSAHYAIISLTSLRGWRLIPKRVNGIWGGGRENERKNRREERVGADIYPLDRSARACNSHTLDSCTRFAFRNVPLRNAPAIACCTGLHTMHWLNGSKEFNLLSSFEISYIREPPMEFRWSRISRGEALKSESDLFFCFSRILLDLLLFFFLISW